jgi:glycosyltransferase involved in cell wall biosynthesis
MLFFSSKVFEVINYCAFAGVIHKWIRNLSVDRSKTILYSYWLNALAFGISLTKNEFPEFTAVSRAHRVDLYQYCSERYLPYRRHILIEMDKVFFISEDGKKYLGQEFPKFKHKIIVSRLGTRDHGLSEKPYDDFQIISCSSVSEVKRIDLIILGLEKFARSNPSKKICWTHIGAGPLMSRIKDKARILDGRDNVDYKFLGRLDHVEVFSYFKNNPVDVLINTSSSEGLPVSIMEAMSFGIPIIATDVGGTSEPVTDKTGILIPGDCSPEDVSEALNSISKKSRSTDFRIGVRNAWKSKVNAQENFTNFAEQLNSISEQKTD